METDSGFTTKGYENVPNLYNDGNYLIPELSRLSSERLGELREHYTTFVSGDPLPHHRVMAERFLTHLDFEERWRGGEFAEDTSL